MRMRVCYIDCHEAGLCCYLWIHIENLLHPLQLFYFHLWPIYWLSLVHKHCEFIGTYYGPSRSNAGTCETKHFGVLRCTGSRDMQTGTQAPSGASSNGPWQQHLQAAAFPVSPLTVFLSCHCSPHPLLLPCACSELGLQVSCSRGTNRLTY
jgi:hypothetical protein